MAGGNSPLRAAFGANEGGVLVLCVCVYESACTHTHTHCKGCQEAVGFDGGRGGEEAGAFDLFGGLRKWDGWKPS